MEKRHITMDTSQHGEVDIPITDIRRQNGLKKAIIELIRIMPSPDRECETTDFLMALQHVLDKHFIRPLPENETGDISEVSNIMAATLIQENQQLRRLIHKERNKYHSKVKKLNKTLEFANNLIKRAGPIEEVDASSLINFIEYIATQGTDDLCIQDQKFYQKIIEEE